MDVNALLNSVLGNTGAGIDRTLSAAKNSGLSSGLVGGAAAGGLAALLLSNKKARKFGTKALQYGGMAAIGGLAYKAWRDYKAGQAAPGTQSQSQPRASASPQPPSGSIFDLARQQSAPATEDIRLSLIQAMISAAKADGHIDAEERTRIEERISQLEIGQEEQMFLVDALNAPSDPIAIARLSTCEEHAAELYVASALALDIDTPDETRYLQRLADALRLPEELRTRLEAESVRAVSTLAQSA